MSTLWPRWWALLSHSARSAITGSILVARQAGNHDAHSVTQQQKNRQREVDHRVGRVDFEERLLQQS